MVLAAFIGRLPLSMVGLGCVLLVAARPAPTGWAPVAAVGSGDDGGGRPVHRPAVRCPRPAPGAAARAGGLGRRPGRVPGRRPRGSQLVVVFATAGLSGACLPPVSRWSACAGPICCGAATGCRPRWPWSPSTTRWSSCSGRCSSRSCPPRGTRPRPGHGVRARDGGQPAVRGAAPHRARAHGARAPRGSSAMRCDGLKVLFVVAAAVGTILGTLQICLSRSPTRWATSRCPGVLIAGLAVGSMISGSAGAPCTGGCPCGTGWPGARAAHPAQRPAAAGPGHLADAAVVCSPASRCRRR